MLKKHIVGSGDTVAIKTDQVPVLTKLVSVNSESKRWAQESLGRHCEHQPGRLLLSWKTDDDRRLQKRYRRSLPDQGGRT